MLLFVDTTATVTQTRIKFFMSDAKPNAISYVQEYFYCEVF